MRQRPASARPPAGASSTERSLALLQYLASQGRAQSLADLASALALPKATTHRICARLLERGFLVRDLNEREYTTGPALRSLAFDALGHGTLSGLRHQVLVDLVERVGETCNFTTLDGASVLYLDRVEAPRPWRLTLNVGVHVPVHCTASGKLLLALMPANRRHELLSRLVLERMTEHTLTSVAALQAECREIAARDHAFDREEFVTGLVAVAVPVRDASGEARATIAMHGPTTHFSLDRASACLPSLETAARRMSRLI
ncbi:MAG: IclR family transcriptional regulator [Lautropia sp.]